MPPEDTDIPFQPNTQQTQPVEINQQQALQPSTLQGSATANTIDQPKSKWNFFKTRKFIVVFVLISLILALAAIGISYFIVNREGEGLEKVEFTSATANWKTYQNEPLAISLKYPTDWEYRDLEPSWDEEGITNKVHFYLIGGNPIGANPNDEITMARFLWKFSLESFVQTSINDAQRISDKGEALTVGGQEARQFNRALLSRQQDVPVNAQIVTTLIKRGEDIFVFEAFIKSENGREIYNEILKSIDFGQKKADAKQTEVKLTNTYTNPTFGYSIKVPDGWKEAQSNDEQKRFRFYIEKQSSGSSDELGFFKAEIQILTLTFTDPAVSKNLDSIGKIKALKDGEEIIIDGIVIKKIKDIKIDGTDAIYTLGKSDDFTLSASVIGKKRYISVIFKGDDQETLDKHQVEFEAAVNTFKFNNFNLD